MPSEVAVTDIGRKEGVIGATQETQERQSRRLSQEVVRVLTVTFIFHSSILS